MRARAALVALSVAAAHSAVTEKAAKGAPPAPLSSAEAKVAVAPVLIQYVGDLKREAEAGRRRAHLVDQWCSESLAQKTSFVAALQRESDELATARRELALQEQRLASEARIANATCAEKARQLSEATASAEFAAEEISAEQQRLDRTMGDTERALKMVEHARGRLQDSGDVQASPDDETAADDAAPKSEKMLFALRELRGKLAQEKAEQVALLRRMTNFSEHVSSAHMEAQSQVAAIRIEAAQRRRESSRLRGRAASLSLLLDAAGDSAMAARALCAADAQHRAEVPSVLKRESLAVAALLDSGAASVGRGRKTNVAAAAPSFLQVEASSSGDAQRAMDELQDLAKRFPEEAELYTAGLQSILESAPVLPAVPKLAVSDDSASPSATASDDDSAYDPLKSVQRFVDEEGTAGAKGGNAASAVEATSHSSPDMSKVKGLYSKLLSSLAGKEAQLTEQQGRCAALLRDASADKSSLGRASARVSANLRLAEATAAEYAQAVAQHAGQREPISKTAADLSVVSKQVDAHVVRVTDRLNSYAQRLIALESSADAATVTDDKYLQRFKDLVQRVEEHKVMLQKHSRSFQDRAAAVEAADAALLQALDEDVRYSNRQLAQLKAQSALLSARVGSTASDDSMAEEFEAMARKLCSEEHLAALRDRIPEVRQQERLLDEAFSPRHGH